MIKKLRKLIPVVVAGAFLSTNAAFAATGEVSPGNLNFSSHTTKTSLTEGTNVTSSDSNITFGNLGTLDIDNTIPSITDNDYIRIDDNRGTSEGWQVKVSATDLIATVADKTTGLSGTTVDVKIPVTSVLKVIGTTPANLSGSLEGIGAQTVQTTVDNSGIAIMTAQKGYGAGTYTTDLTYTLSLPTFLPVGSTLTPTDTTNSKFATVTDPTRLGLFSGSYSTTVQYSITVAP